MNGAEAGTLMLVMWFFYPLIALWDILLFVFTFWTYPFTIVWYVVVDFFFPDKDRFSIFDPTESLIG